MRISLRAIAELRDGSANVVNLMEVLRRSVEGGAKSGAKAPSKKVAEDAPKKRAKKAARG